jgi:hypothetical protein
VIRALRARRAARRFNRQPVTDLTEWFAPVLDELAVAYDTDPAAVGALLRHHARAALTLDETVVSPYATDVQRMVARAELDGSRAALLAYAPAADHLRLGLCRAECMRLADDLTARAAEIHLNAPGETA